MEKIKVIAKEVGKPARPYEIENSYKAIKDFVGGKIETHDHPTFDEVTIYCNRDFQNTDVTIVLEEHQVRRGISKTENRRKRCRYGQKKNFGKFMRK